jgi:hypothetical protein
MSKGSIIVRDRLDVKSVKRSFINFMYMLRVENKLSVEYVRKSNVKTEWLK